MSERKFKVTDESSGLIGKIGYFVKEHKYHSYIILDIEGHILAFHVDEVEEITV